MFPGFGQSVRFDQKKLAVPKSQKGLAAFVVGAVAEHFSTTFLFPKF